MTTEQAIEKLNRYEAEAAAIRHCIAVLTVDGDTVAPKASYRGRGKTLSYLSGLMYKATVNDEMKEMLETLLADPEHCSEKVLRQATLLKEDYDKLFIMPAEEYSANIELINEASAVWHEAKEKSDYAMFAPYLEKLIAYKRRYAQMKDSSRPVYDVVLDDFQKELNMEILDPFFKTVRDDLAPVIREVVAKDRPEYPFTKAYYPIDTQRHFAQRVMDLEGLPKDRCTIGETEHPFSEPINRWDVRITTRYRERDLFSGMFSVLHEGGHALYELGIDEELQFSVLAKGSCAALHESQSRFYENLICRSLPFCRVLLPVLQEYFPEQMKGVTADELYRGINYARPSAVRTEADELTYPMHIAIRYEIEKMIFKGEVGVKDLPILWNDMYDKYLGVKIHNDKEGVLQDCHWSQSLFGYFPGYAVGSAYGVQMLKNMEKDIDVWGNVEKGNMAPITAWLDEKLHRYGCLKQPGWLMENAMGGPLDAKIYTEYMKNKYLSM